MSGALKDSSSGLQTTGRTCGSISKSAAKRYSGPYVGTPLEPIVDGLLSDSQLFLDELTDEQIDLLRDSDLEDYVELSLS